MKLVKKNPRITKTATTANIIKTENNKDIEGNDEEDNDREDNSIKVDNKDKNATKLLIAYLGNKV